MLIERDMSISHRDFFRSAARALDGVGHTIHGCQITVPLDGGEVRINLGDEGERRIALVCLPRTQVTITFDSVDETQANRFLAQFDKYFQRGGG